MPVSRSRARSAKKIDEKYTPQNVFLCCSRMLRHVRSFLIRKDYTKPCNLQKEGRSRNSSNAQNVYRVMFSSITAWTNTTIYIYMYACANVNVKKKSMTSIVQKYTPRQPNEYNKHKILLQGLGRTSYWHTKKRNKKVRTQAVVNDVDPPLLHTSSSQEAIRSRKRK